MKEKAVIVRKRGKFRGKSLLKREGGEVPRREGGSIIAMPVWEGEGGGYSNVSVGEIGRGTLRVL